MKGKMGKKILVFILFNVLLFYAAKSDDAAAMAKIAGALSPAPASWTGTDYCKWDGVKCFSNSVTSIFLSNRKLTGTLAKEVASLASLQTLQLQGNSLSGDLPLLGGLSSLSQLLLDGNNFTAVPNGFFDGLTGLTDFSISQNLDLAGWSIPAGLSAATGLTKFEASNAGIVGTIPDIFASFPSLTELRLSYNQLTGDLPKSFANSQITHLWVNNQKAGLSGSIDVLASMPNLIQVWLHKNNFSGPVPDLSKCGSLFDLQLRDNIFTGVIPDSLINLPDLLNVSLANNRFQGPTPKFSTKVKVDNDGLNSFCLTTPGVQCDEQVTTLIGAAAGFGYPLKLATSWTGNDACSDWAFVTCISGKVSTVNLGKQYFGGIISPAFGNLTSLKGLYLNDNNLTGKIPDSLTKLTSLQTLDVSNNNLSGKIPNFANSPNPVTIKKDGNPFLGTDVDTGGGGSGSPGSPTSGGNSSGSKSGGNSAGLIAGIAVAALVVFVALLLFVMYKYHAKKKRAVFAKVKDQESGNVTGSVAANCCTSGYGVLSEALSQDSGNRSDHHVFEGGNAVFPIEMLRQVTDNFNERNILGKGGFGVVYRGELHDGTKIAVKRMEASQMSNKGVSEFQAEIGVLTKVRHRHLVALLGYCVNGAERLLVYEYMPQGTLSQHLFEWQDHSWPPLAWKQRITIALDVARGVEYLHSLAQQSFIHRDLKPSNILLGDDMRAKVADFGLVKLAPDGKYSMETRLAGTFGYLAPEYAATGRVTTKVDVYAFGVILMEIITGRKALEPNDPEETAHLVAWFRRVLITKKDIGKAIDQTLQLEDEEAFASIHKVAELAGHCTAREPNQRPDMGHAVNILGPLVEQWTPTNQDNEDGADLPMSLPEWVNRWQNEGTSTMYDLSYSQTQGSIPEGIMKNTFNSTEGR